MYMDSAVVGEGLRMVAKATDERYHRHRCQAFKAAHVKTRDMYLDENGKLRKLEIGFKNSNVDMEDINLIKVFIFYDDDKPVMVGCQRNGSSSGISIYEYDSSYEVDSFY